jgi:N-[(2S)-2-amino-2-carboxyethyl]-L-glutamate dehydrogenase
MTDRMTSTFALPRGEPLSAPPRLDAPVTDAHIDAVLSRDRGQVMRLVTEAYHLFAEGQAVEATPSEAYHLFAEGQAVEATPSYLHPPHDVSARIIAKPACLYGDTPVAGVKWVSSFPGNVGAGLPRASGLLVLNDMHTGLPIGSLEVAAINAHRTSASAVMALNRLHGRPRSGQTIALVGTGHIGWQMACYLAHEGWTPRTWVLRDLDAGRADAFARRLQALTPGVDIQQAASAGQAVAQSEIAVFTTTAGVPHLHELALKPEQTLLHISLRDLGVPLIAQAHNYVDSAELAFSHRTSLQLAEQALGHRDFLSGEIGRVLTGSRPADGKPVIFSPFGMAVLDLAVGQWVLNQR